MSSSINGVIENWILNTIVNYKPKLKVQSDNINSIIYELVFPDTKTLCFKIEYNPINGIEFHFISTTIIHLSTLTLVLQKLTNGLEYKASEIQAYFEA